MPKAVKKPHGNSTAAKLQKAGSAKGQTTINDAFNRRPPTRAPLAELPVNLPAQEECVIVDDDGVIDLTNGSGDDLAIPQQKQHLVGPTGDEDDTSNQHDFVQDIDRDKEECGEEETVEDMNSNVSIHNDEPYHPPRICSRNRCVEGKPKNGVVVTFNLRKGKDAKGGPYLECDLCKAHTTSKNPASNKKNNPKKADELLKAKQDELIRLMSTGLKIPANLNKQEVEAKARKIIDQTILKALVHEDCTGAFYIYFACILRFEKEATMFLQKRGTNGTARPVLVNQNGAQFKNAGFEITPLYQERNYVNVGLLEKELHSIIKDKMRVPLGRRLWRKNGGASVKHNGVNELLEYGIYVIHNLKYDGRFLLNE